jgi:Na+/pantothenate symporter
VFGEIPIAAWLVGRYAAARWQSRVFALQYVLSLGVSAAVVPLIVVLYEATGGFEALFLTMAAAAVVVAIAALLLPRGSRPRRKRRRHRRKVGIGHRGDRRLPT